MNFVKDFEDYINFPHLHFQIDREKKMERKKRKIENQKRDKGIDAQVSRSS